MTNYEDPNIVHAGVEACPVHDTSPAFDEDCEGCQKEVAHRSKVINDMQAEAANRARGLAQQGIPFGQSALDSIKVNIMWETMFTGRQSFIAEAEVGRRAILIMQDIQKQANRQNLMAPPNSGGLHVVRNGGKPK